MKTSKVIIGCDHAGYNLKLQVLEHLKEKGVEFEKRHKKGDILNLFFEEFVEHHLIQPTFVMDHPVEISPLTKKKPDDPDYVERFEMFMKLVECDIEDILAELEKFARYAVKQIVILFEAELDREKNGKTDLIALFLCLKICVAELIHLLGEGQILAKLLEMVGREMV